MPGPSARRVTFGAIHWVGALVVAIPSAAFVSGCGSADAERSAAGAEAGTTGRDSRPDGLFADFLDGKYDGAGHPLGAIVIEAETGCAPQAGQAEAEGWGAHPGQGPAVLCRGSIDLLDKGMFVLNARVLGESLPADGTTPLLTTVILDAQGQTLAEQPFATGALVTAMQYQNLHVAFGQTQAGPVSFEVRWAGQSAVRLDYVEVFRAQRRLLLDPASGVFDPAARLVFELTDPPDDASFTAACGDSERTAILQELLEAGKATRTDTEFRSSLDVPAGELLGDCPLPTRLVVTGGAGAAWQLETSRLSFVPEEAPCTFEPGKTRVLLTGFEPFPADSRHENSAERAVMGFDASGLPEVSVMRLILPVEYDTAPAWVVSAIDRCAPDVVVGFGQGRSAVDVETTAYNLRDTGEVAGGVPDNRGTVYAGQPISASGPARHATGLPSARIVDRLRTEGIDAGPSDDPGRYVCNNVFFTVMERVAGESTIGGFVHLPRLYQIDEAAQAQLQTVVRVVVEEAVAARQ